MEPCVSVASAALAVDAAWFVLLAGLLVLAALLLVDFAAELLLFEEGLAGLNTSASAFLLIVKETLFPSEVQRISPCQSVRNNFTFCAFRRSNSSLVGCPSVFSPTDITAYEGETSLRNSLLVLSALPWQATFKTSAERTSPAFNKACSDVVVASPVNRKDVFP